MSTSIARSLQIYEELGTWYDRQGQAKLRDWFLVLAADAALTLGQPDQAEKLRQRLLHANPHHLLRPFASIAEAMESPDVQGYVADLRRNYPLETAEQLLQSSQKKGTAADRDLKVFRGQTKTAEAAALPRPEKSKVEPSPREASPASRQPQPVRHENPNPPPAPIQVVHEPVLPPRPVPPVRPAPPPRVQAPNSEPGARGFTAPARQESPVVTPKPWAQTAHTGAVAHDEEPTAVGYWVSTGLFVVTLCVGIGLAGYTLLRPFVF
jgi:hypothetical protein